MNDMSVYARIDWKLLKQQKARLVELNDRDLPGNEWIDGLLGFIDAIMDDAEGRGYPVEYWEESE